jgi:hypothetical protein
MATKTSTLEFVGESSGGDSFGREKSFEPVTMNVARKLPYREQFEVGALTM